MNSASPLATRFLLVDVARKEASKELSGNAQMAGPAIEPYLSVLRDALNRNGSTTIYSDLSVGFNWCCAFVYYCCLKAGFRFPPKPISDYRYTLGAVPAWYHWAITGDFFYPSETSVPQLGDIALFNRVFDGNPLDHIGIVVDFAPSAVITAEGNNSNRTGIFTNDFSVIEGYVRLPEGAQQDAAANPYPHRVIDYDRFPFPSTRHLSCGPDRSSCGEFKEVDAQHPSFLPPAPRQPLLHPQPLTSAVSFSGPTIGARPRKWPGP